MVSLWSVNDLNLLATYGQAMSVCLYVSMYLCIYVCLSVCLSVSVCVAVCPGGCGAGNCQSPFHCACPADLTGDHCETSGRYVVS